MVDSGIEFKPRPLSRRTWIRLGLIAIVVAILYWLVANFYNAEGGYKYTTPPPSITGNGVVVDVDPVTVNAQTNLVELYLSFTVVGPDLIDSQGHLSQNVRVILDAASGTRELRFPTGTVANPTTIELPLNGELAQYPFDTHDGSGFISADTYTRNADTSLTSNNMLPVGIQMTTGVSGWDTTVDVTSTAAGAAMGLTFARAFSTQAFAIMLLVLAVLLAASTVVVAFLVASQRRRAEIGLMSWTAALLFALPALRTFMPNSPPIGAAIDMYVYLWVMAGAIAAAIIMIVTWVRQSGRELQVDPTAGLGGVPHIPDAPSADGMGD